MTQSARQPIASSQSHPLGDEPSGERALSLPTRRRPPEQLISLHRASVELGGRPILENVDLAISSGEIVTIIGPNGGGKTTLVRVMLGLLKPGSGKVFRKAGLRVGYVPQTFARDSAIPLSTGDFLGLGVRATPSQRREVLTECGAERVYDTQLRQLSGGEFQRVLLARAILRNPQLLVLDEPVRGVDHLGEADLYKLIGRLRDERGFGVLMVSHDLHVVMAASDRVICLNRHICCSGQPMAVAKHPEYARLFGQGAASAFAVYEHHHDHEHGLSGEPLDDHDHDGCGHSHG